MRTVRSSRSQQRRARCAAGWRDGHRYGRVSLETGSQDFFAPARRLYARHGFVECGPFGSYALDPNSVFMSLDLPGQH